MLKNFAAEFMQHIWYDLQFLTIIRHKFKWQNFIIIIFNVQQRQKRLADNIRIMKRYWFVESVNALITSIKLRHIKEKTIKLTMKYFNEYEKAVELMQQTILQRRKQIYRKVKTIANYILINFKNVFSKNYQNQILSISAALKNVDLRQKNQQLIKNISNFASTIIDYVLSFNIRSISLFNFKEVIASFRKSLINDFNTFTFFSRFARFVLLFSNLSRQISTFFLSFARFVAFFFQFIAIICIRNHWKASEKNFMWNIKVFHCKEKYTVNAKNHRRWLFKSDPRNLFIKKIAKSTFVVVVFLIFCCYRITCRCSKESKISFLCSREICVWKIRTKRQWLQL